MNPSVEEPVLDLGHFLDVLWRKRGIIQWCAAVCVVFSLLYGLLWPKTYQAVTTVKVPGVSANAGGSSVQDMAFLQATADAMETYIQIAMADKVAAGAIDNLNLSKDSRFHNMDKAKLIWYLQHQVKVDNVKESNLLSIAARSATGQGAADLANGWAQSFIQVNQDLYQESEEARYKFLHGQLNSIRQKLDADRANKQNYLNESSEAEADQLIYKSLLEQEQESRIRSNNENTGIVVVDTAVVPDRPVSPKKVVSLVVGLMVGLFLGTVAAFLLETMEDRLYEEEDLASTAPYWAGVSSPGSLLLSAARPLDPEYAQSFKALRARLLLARPESGPLALGIVSSRRGEGRTLTTANLGLALAQAGKKVLLVDADLENPGLGALFGVESANLPGLSGLLAGQAGLKEATRPSGVPNLTLLPAPAGSTDLSGVLSPTALKKWTGEAKSKFDYLLFDGAPLLASADAVVGCAALDGVLLLARWGVTVRKDFQESVQRLQTVHIPLWGTVLNAVKTQPGPWLDLGFPFRNPRPRRGMAKSQPSGLRAS